MVSQELIAPTGVGHAVKIIDADGGASGLVDELMKKGLRLPEVEQWLERRKQRVRGNYQADRIL